MSDSLLSILALIVTLGVLIAFHEFGHFWVARRLGVKVLRFSVGFGKPLWLRRGGIDNTEYAIAAIPLGGYVRMLDEREADVPPEERHRAFNRQSVWVRIAIVIAGPLFNFIFAILAFSAIYMIGVNATRPLLAEPLAGSIAANGGFKEGDEITAVDDDPVKTLDSALLALVDRSMAGEIIEVTVRDRNGDEKIRELDVRGKHGLADNGQLLDNLGLRPWRPVYPPVIDQIIADSAAQRDGLLPGDLILGVDDEPVENWTRWAEMIRQRPGQSTVLLVQRGAEQLTLTVVPDTIDTDSGPVGRIGATARIPVQELERLQVKVHFGPLQAFLRGAEKTWDMSIFTLRMLWRMLVGTASLENISGPITIAQFAGQTAAIGWAAFLSFMALVSISLGVLNLLPIPILDGGHLLYYLIELIKGSPLSDAVQFVGQRIGIALIIMLMSLALFNDFTRLIG